MSCSIVSSITVTMLYVRSLELTLLSVGIDRISANIWSSDSQACILPIMLDQTLDLITCKVFPFLMDLGEQREAIHRAVFGKAQSFFRKSED